MADNSPEQSQITPPVNIRKQILIDPHYDQLLENAQKYLEKSNQPPPASLPSLLPQPLPEKTPSSPQEEASTASILQKRIGRRGFLGLFGLGAAAAGVAIGVTAINNAIPVGFFAQETPKPTATLPVTTVPTEAPKLPEKVTFKELLKPLIEKAHKRRANRAQKEGPEYYHRVDKELNTDLINFGLSAWSQGRGESITVLSYNIKTGKITTISCTRETVTPEVIRFNQKKDPNRKDTYSRGFGSNMFLYNTGGFDLMRQVIEDETGLSADFQLYMDEMALNDFIQNVVGTVDIEVKKDFKLIDQDWDPRWRDDNSGRYTINKGVHTMTAKEALRYVYAQEDDPVLGPRDGPDRKNDLVRGCFNAFSKAIKLEPLLIKAKFGAWMLRENSPLIGRIKTDFDIGDIIELMTALAPVVSKISPDELPSVDNEQLLLNDQLFGGGGMMRIINRYITPNGQPDIEYPNAHPNMQKLLDRTMKVMAELEAKGIDLDDEKVGLPGMGVLPLFAQVPIYGDPEAVDLVRDYWGSARKLVRDRLMAA